MSAVSAPPPPGRPEPEGAARTMRWVLSAPGSGWPSCAGHHPGGTGHLDERARRLSHEELGVAELLAGDGHRVRSLAEFRRGGRRADLDVCGSAVEIKSFLPLAERHRPPSAQSVSNKLLDGAGQAHAVVLYGRGSGLTAATVRAGLGRLVAEGKAGSLAAVRAVGDGFDLAWVRRPVLAHQLPSGRPRLGPSRPELGL